MICKMTEQRKRILVIDDNPAIQEDFRKILSKNLSNRSDMADMESVIFGSEAENLNLQFFEVNCASQGKEGYEMVLQARSDGYPYALAFVDGRMPPGWDGVETINKIWKECPELQVVLCTAYADYSWQEIRRVLGVSDNLLILKKPFDNIEVLQIAHAMVSKWELNREVQRQVEYLDSLVKLRTEEKDQVSILLEAALSHSPAGIIISNEDGSKIMWSNQAAEEIFGGGIIPPADSAAADGDSVFNAFRNGENKSKEEEFIFSRTILNEEVIHNETLLFKNLQGRDKWISFNSAPIRNSSGEKIAAIIIFNDISEHKFIEIENEKLRDRMAQIQKMDSVGLLAGGVAHDYNNTMSVILGSAEIGMLSIDNSDPAYEIFRQIKKAAHRSADLTQQLLAFARKQAIKPRVIDLNKKITDLLKILNRLIGENIDISWQPGTDLWPVNIDPSQVDQVLINLCANCRDAIDEVGKITLETGNIIFKKSDLSKHPELKGHEYVALNVADDGQGIPKDFQSRIFEPFFTTKDFGKGTGLGLATVYGIIKQNEGYIDVESKPGKGTTFTVYLPRYMGEVKTSADEKLEIKKSVENKKILMVEDKEDVLYIGRQMLEKLGYSVVTASTPDKAILQAEKIQGNIDLLITDVIMPKMNGQELAAKLKSLYPGLKCLFMSGYTADIISDQGVLDEKTHFLQKPFTFDSLATKVRAALYDEYK